MARYGYIKFKEYYVPINESYKSWVGDTLPEYVRIPKSELLSPIDFNSVSWASRTGVNDYYALTSFQYLYDAFTEMSWFELTEDNTNIPVNHMLFQVTPGDYRLMPYIYRSGSAYRYYCYSSVINGPNGAATSDDIILADYLYIWFKLTSYANGSLSFCVSTVPPVTPTGYLSRTVQYLRSDLNYDTVNYSTYESIFNVYTERPKNAVNFYIFSPDPNIKLNRGDSIEYRYIIVYDDDTSELYTDVIYSDLSFKNGGKIANIENNILTIAETCTASVVSFTAKPNIKNTKLFASALIEIANPLGIYDEGGNSGASGGDGSFSGPGGSWGNGIGPAPSTDITGDIPNGSAESNSSSTGLFTRYAVNNAELQSVGLALYAETILAQATKAVMSFLWNSPSEALISLISYPFDVTSIISTTSSSVKFGAIDLEAVTASRLNGTFAQIDWGTIQLTEYWGNFLDYAPHTKIELYLPWCTGSVYIDPHEVLPGSIRVITNIEISKGTCVHNVFGNKGALIGTYSGTCGSQLPMTALDTSGKALALVTAAAGALIAGAAAGGGTSAGIAAANSPHTAAMAYSLENSRGLEPMAARVIAQKEAIAKVEAPYRAIEKRATQAALVSSVAAFRTPATIQRNGSFTGNGAGMSVQFPFVIVSRPEQNIPDNYGKFYGYPSNVYARIGSIRGYTEIGSVHVNGLTGATLEEVEEVERLLKGGVIL